MANALYAKAKEKFLSGAIDLLTDDIKVSAVDGADYTPDLNADEFFDDIPSGAIVDTTANLSGKSVTGGVFDASDVTLTSVSGDPFEMLVIWKDTGTPATSPLIAKIDTATGLPATPAGVDIPIVWDSGANKIFAL